MSGLYSKLQQIRLTLSSKLMILFLSMAVLFVILVGISISAVFRGHFDTKILPHIIQYLEYVRTDIGNSEKRVRAQQLATQLNIVIQIHDQDGIWNSAGKQTDLSVFELRHRHKYKDQVYEVGEINDQQYLINRNEDLTLVFTVPHTRFSRSSYKGLLPITILLLVLLLLYYFTRRLISPIKTIQVGVEHYAHGDLVHRIEVNRSDELGDLAKNINSMANEIHSMLNAKQQLLLAISHELRSPLTRAKVALELLDDSKVKKNINYDLDEMELLIAELLEAERLNSRHRTLKLEPVELNALLTELIDKYFNSDKIILKSNSDQYTILADEARLKLLFRNLIKNAIEHADQSMPVVEVILDSGENDVEILIKDNGPGIAKEHLAAITEPFYRIDQARTHKSGGYGLGLYLSKSIVDAHQGMLKISSEVSAGTQVFISLPKNTKN